jgi:S-methylmethionine-dependent homocysteine/selenocysteine methylase
MSKYRKHLPQTGNGLFLTDGGLETTLVFHDGRELPCFAAFTLLENETGFARLRRYFDDYLAIARRHGVGAVLEAPTWRANADWAAKLGYDAAALADVNRRAIGLMLELRDAYETARTPMVISGNLGPRGDGYRAERRMSTHEAQTYHARQIDTFADTDADLISAFTINYSDEAIGIVAPAGEADMPAVISFTVETDGRLPSGETLAEAIERTDAETGGYVAYYMLNCAHPTHFQTVLNAGGGWRDRIRGLRANASRKSHAELDESTELDPGNPEELGREYRDLRTVLPGLNVLGGCCGTDHQHIDAIFHACAVSASGAG